MRTVIFSRKGSAGWMPALLLCLIALLSGCAATPQSDALREQWQAGDSDSVELTDVPFFPQEKYQCGPAALATTLNYEAVDVSPEELVNMVYVPEKRGSFQVEMLAATRRHGLIPYVIDPDISAMVSQIQAGKPVLVMQNLGIKWAPQWHYAVAVGVDARDEKVILRSGEMERRNTPIKVFENTWRRSGFWGFVALQPGELPANADESRYFLAVSEFAGNGSEQDMEAALKTGLQHWPDSKPLNMAMANLYFERGDLRAAERHYRKLTTLYPDFAPAHNNLANLLLESGQIDQARGYAETAVLLGGRFLTSYQATLDDINRFKAQSRSHGRQP